MATPKYFSNFPNIEYALSANKAGKANTINIKDYFRLLRVRDDIYREDTLYTTYVVKDGERPDQISWALYEDEQYYWIILQINDIVDYYSEWPLSVRELEQFCFKKYGGVRGAEQVHHWETVETLDADGNLMLPGGMVVYEDFSFTYPNSREETVYFTSFPVAVTNIEYEQRLNDKKAEIQVLDPKYIYDYKRDINNYARLLESQASRVDISATELV